MAATPAAVAHYDVSSEVDVAAVAAIESARRCLVGASGLSCDTVRGDLARINTILVRYEQYSDVDSHRCSHASRPELDGSTGRDGAHHTAVYRLITPNAHESSNQYREDRCVVGSVDHRAACLRWTRECQIRHEYNGTVDDPHDRNWLAWRDPPSAPTDTVVGRYDSSIRLVGREPCR